MYYRQPDEASIAAAKAEYGASSGNSSRDLSESPNRKRLRDRAVARMAMQGSEMKKRAKKKDGGSEVTVGTIVQVRVDNVDRAKTDPTNATLVVVELVKTGKRKIETKYRLACKAGPLKSLFCRSAFTPVAGMTHEVLGLTNALESWHGMPVVGIRAAMKTISAVGGQGLLHCTCKSSCNSRTCKCFKNNRKCNSRCHKRSTQCTNHDS